jgi:uncharacterized protein YecT (DUF1311 family)
MFKIVTLTVILTFNFCSYAQTLKEVIKIESKYQKCLDTGNGMMYCALDFELKSDSLLNVAYKNLKLKLNIIEQNNLKIEQRKWLKKRDKYFEKSLVVAKIENGGETEGSNYKMLVLDKQGEFVIKRVKELIIRRNYIK